jgi:hypothetical protein
MLRTSQNRRLLRVNTGHIPIRYCWLRVTTVLSEQALQSCAEAMITPEVEANYDQYHGKPEV